MTFPVKFYSSAMEGAPLLSSGNAAAGKAIDGWHQAAEWTLLVIIAIHVVAALAHMFYYRDRIMQRMLPG